MSSSFISAHPYFNITGDRLCKVLKEPWLPLPFTAGGEPATPLTAPQRVFYKHITKVCPS